MAAKTKPQTLAQREKELLNSTKSLLDKHKDALEARELIIEKEQSLHALEEKQKINLIESSILLKKITILRETIGYCEGQSDFFGIMEPIYAKRILTEDEVLEYKGKLLELIKQL